MFGLFHKIAGKNLTVRIRLLRVFLIILLGLVTLTGCQRALSVIFDIPQKTETPSASQPVVGRAQTNVVAADTLRPAIEEILIADSVKKMLPRDHAGNIDWMAALRDGTIRPRNSINGPLIPLLPDNDGFVFGFDFSFRGPAPMFDAFFPHSAHTQWVNCQQCHGPIFKYRDDAFQMADVLAGNYCGECHGKVSFPPITSCERCHLDLPQQPNRAQPLLLGTIRMTRVERTDTTNQNSAVQISTNQISTDQENTAGISQSDSGATGTLPTEVLISEASLPPAVFPHWVHRIRFTCKACHMDLFEPRAGANAITMQDISAGEACGACHNGTVAFDAGFGACQRCHTPPGSETL